MKKSKIIAIISIVAALSVLIVILSLNARPYLTVTEVRGNPSNYNGSEIQVIGRVEEFNDSLDHFYLVEDDNELLINVSGVSVPNDLETGTEIVVTGTLINENTIMATQILTQCS